MGGALEEELIKVIRTLEELQHKYIGLLENDDVGAADDPSDTLNDYQVLAEKMLEWIAECDSITRMNILLHRSMVRCCETSHASLLIPILRIMKKIILQAGGRDITCHSSQMFRKLAVNLCKKIVVSSDALKRSNSDSIFYSKYEAKEILEKCSCILNFICQYNSNITRFIIEKFEEFKPSLQYYVHMYRHEDSKSLFEAVESEEECMKESGRKSEATVLIQATFRMYQQKCKWKKIKSGMIALQRLVRQRQMKKDLADSQKQEELKFLQELDNVSVRKKEMERRYKLLSKLHPNRVNSFLESEKEAAAKKIQSWWRKVQPQRRDHESTEEQRRLHAVLVLQSYLRQWLTQRHKSPGWSSVITQPRVITEERDRHLRREIEVWQQKHTVYCGEQDMDEIHSKIQQRYHKFVAGLPSRRMAEHRSKLVRAQIKANIQVLESAPGLSDYNPDDWGVYHALPLDVATAARMNHTLAMEQLHWPDWKRRIHDIVNS